jgi:hypothetical protein
MAQGKWRLVGVRDSGDGEMRRRILTSALQKLVEFWMQLVDRSLLVDVLY